MKPFLQCAFGSGLLALTLILALSNPPPASATPGFVGLMYPTGGSTGTINPGGTFDVYVQVWQAGITEPAGQGPNLSCTLSWSAVGYFGGGWNSTINTTMVYNTSIGNNDEYRGTISPGVGLYEFTAFCTDLTDNTSTYQGNGNGKLIVKTPGADACSSAAQADNNIFYSGLKHDSFSTAYRNPGGAVTTAQGAVTLKFRTCMNDLNQSPYLRVYDLKNAAETLKPGMVNAQMAFESHSYATGVGDVTTWSFTLPIPTSVNLYYYVFRANDGASGQAFYRALNKNEWSGGYSNPGGQGEGESDQTTAYDNSFQLTIYDPAFSVPAWMQKGIVYQIFPDRFRDGNSANNPASGRFFYDEPGGTIVRSNTSTWNTKICDPRGVILPQCVGAYSNNFYGGDLQGITDKINQGFFDNLGVSVIYLNPIFRSPSNHKYDTADYLTIDPDFGTLPNFQALATAAENHNIKLILDGVFNHTSSDSTYFDRYFRYNPGGTLSSPNGVGADDNSGACEDTNSPFRSWFYLPATNAPGRDGDPGSGALALCDPIGAGTTTYEAWYGYSSLPKLQANTTDVRNLIWANGTNSVGPYWTSQGADGWRFDVGADVDQGLSSPTNTYWEGFRSSVRAVNSETLLLGEEWDDASKWLLGTEWDSVMNYRFRAAVLAWLFTGCASGDGCGGGTVFSENDSNGSSSSGSISYLSPSQFNARLRSIQEDYPPMAFKAMMNVPGSHDTQRVRFLLKKINNDSEIAAVQRMKEWWLFAFTYAGAPTLYYGDEVGLSQDGVASGGTYQDDPYNRVPYPWDDTPGDLLADTTDLLVFERKMASIRLAYPALQDGDVQHGILVDDANKMYGYARTNGSQTALIVLNRDGSSHNAVLSGLNASPYNLPNGTVLYDAIEGNAYTVSGGTVTVPVNPSWGIVLLEQAKIDAPIAPQNLTAAMGTNQNFVQWSPTVTDTGGGRELATSYTVHRSPVANFTPDGSNLLATVTPAAFGTANGKVLYIDTNPSAPAEASNGTNYYAVCAVNAVGSSNCSSALAPTGNPACPNLERPTLLAPADDSTVQDRRVVLDWADSLCLPKYKVIVRVGAKKGPRAERAKRLAESEFTTKPLARGQEYYWRVNSCAQDSCRRSQWFTFRIE
jgi:glycosidase